MKLREYQEIMIGNTREALKQNSRVLLQGPTGCGKTAITVYMMGRAADAGKRAMFIVHQNELLTQTSKALWNQKLEHGMIASGKQQSKLPVQVASVQTLVNRLDRTQEPDLIIIDESHRAAASTYQRVIEYFPNAKVIGLTATPQRTDGKGLDDLFSFIVKGPSIRWLIDQGFLADYEVYAPSIAFDTTGIKTVGGDFNKGQLEKAIDKPTITGDAVNHYKKFASGKRCVVMCATINHAEHVSEQYNANGIKAAQIDGKMTESQRADVLRKFSAGEILVICNVQLLIEGVDIPAIEVVQWLRPTQSLIVWMQGNGRGLRPATGKDKLIILDHVGNTLKHGLPCEDREWSLEGKKKGKRKKSDDEPDVQVQQCMKCYAVFKPGPDCCPMCGEVIERKVRKIEYAEGELQAVDMDAVRRARKQEQGMARDIRGLVELGVRRGMKKPAAWAAITYSARAGRKPTREEFTQARRLYIELMG